jgi:hypothetical protein
MSKVDYLLAISHEGDKVFLANVMKDNITDTTISAVTEAQIDQIRSICYNMDSVLDVYIGTRNRLDELRILFKFIQKTKSTEIASECMLPRMSMFSKVAQAVLDLACEQGIFKDKRTHQPLLIEEKVREYISGIITHVPGYELKYRHGLLQKIASCETTGVLVLDRFELKGTKAKISQRMSVRRIPDEEHVDFEGKIVGIHTRCVPDYECCWKNERCTRCLTKTIILRKHTPLAGMIGLNEVPTMIEKLFIQDKGMSYLKPQHTKVDGSDDHYEFRRYHESHSRLGIHIIDKEGKIYSFVEPNPHTAREKTIMLNVHIDEKIDDKKAMDFDLVRV